MEMAPVFISKDEMLKISNEQDWHGLWQILMVHTIKRLLYRYGIRESNLELQTRAREHLSEVVNLILVEQTRNWNTIRYLTFKDFLISVVDSELSNAFSKKPSIEEPTDKFEDHGISEGAQEQILYKELKDRVFALLQAAEADDDELLFFDCMADGIVKRSEIIANLGISENDYRKIWRRLEPKLIKIRKTIESNG
jgi:hypothetical protein